MILKRLTAQIEWYSTMNGEEVFKQTLDDTFHSISSLETSDMIYGGRKYETPKRWIICLLGSLRHIRVLDGIEVDGNVNIIVICITQDDID